jgi:hypothetical protein
MANKKEGSSWDQEALKKQVKKYEEEYKKQQEHLRKNDEIVNRCLKENEEMKKENDYIKKELKYSLLSQLQKAKMELEARDEEEKNLKNMVEQLMKDKKDLEKQIILNLEMYQNENKKRDEDIEFLLLAFSEMKNREAREYDYVFETLNDLANRINAQK